MLVLRQLSGIVNPQAQAQDALHLGKAPVKIRLMLRLLYFLAGASRSKQCWQSLDQLERLDLPADIPDSLILWGLIGFA